MPLPTSSDSNKNSRFLITVWLSLYNDKDTVTVVFNLFVLWKISRQSYNYASI